MSRIPGLRRVFRLAVGRRGVHKDIDEEIRFHLDVRTEELISAGYTPADAEAKARKEFGDIAKYRAQLENLGSRKASRARRADLVDGFRQDVSFALRQLWRNKGFALAAALTLGLGIGATTAMFSVVNGVLLRPLPYPDPDRLVEVRYSYRSTGEVGYSLSQPDLTDLQNESPSLQFVTGWTRARRTYTGEGEPEVITGAAVTQGILTTFAVTPAMGRDILPAENATDGPDVVVLSQELWTNRFQGDPNVVGKTLMLSGVPYEIIGVAPEGFDFPRGALFWVPEQADLEDCGRGCHFLSAVGRLASGSGLEAARQEATAIGRRLEEAYVDSNYDRGFALLPLSKAQTEDDRTALLVLLGSVTLVLLIASANVANLLLVRGSRRRGEIAIRAALGAGRSRILTQLLIENGVLSLIGGGLGLGMAFVGLDALLGMAPPSLPRLDEVSVDGPVLLFTLATVTAVALIFGLVPALRLSRSSLSASMGAGGRGRVGPSGRDRSRSMLLVAEVALSLVLLLGSGLLLRSFARLSQVDPGFRSEDLHQLTLVLPGSAYETPEEKLMFFEAMEDEFRALPGVLSVGSVFGVPMGSVSITAGFEQTDRPPLPPGQEPEAAWRVVTPGYFETMEIPVRQGRAFEPGDRVGAQPVVVVNQAFADRFFAGENPLGKPILPQVSMSYDEEEPRLVVGVVGNARYEDMSVEPVPAFYVPQAQIVANYLTFILRTRSGSLQANAVRDLVRRMDPNLPIRDMAPMTAVIDETLGPARFNLLLLGIFSGLALVMAAVGLYGVVAYLVTQRTREIAVRMALGAKSGDVVGLVLGQGIRPALIGIAVGLILAAAGGRVLAALLFEVEPTDAVSYAGATAVLLAVVVLASVLPAIRASRVAPMAALKEE